MISSWEEEEEAAAAGLLRLVEAVCAAGAVDSTVAELGDTTFAFALCFFGVFWVLALMGDDDDAMGSAMVVLSGGDVFCERPVHAVAQKEDLFSFSS